MLHSFSINLSKKISNLQNIEDNDKTEILAYGIEIALASIITVLIITTLSGIFNRLSECYIFLAVFMPLRTYTGGYHAPTHFQCLLTLLVNLITGEILLLALTDYLILSASIMLVCACIIILRFSPIEHTNRPLSSRQKIKFRKTSIKILCFILICISALLLYRL